MEKDDKKVEEENELFFIKSKNMPDTCKSPKAPKSKKDFLEVENPLLSSFNFPPIVDKDYLEEILSKFSKTVNTKNNIPNGRESSDYDASLSGKSTESENSSEEYYAYKKSEFFIEKEIQKDFLKKKRLLRKKENSALHSKSNEAVFTQLSNLKKENEEVFFKNSEELEKELELKLDSLSFHCSKKQNTKANFNSLTRLSLKDDSPPKEKKQVFDNTSNSSTMISFQCQIINQRKNIKDVKEELKKNLIKSKPPYYSIKCQNINISNNNNKIRKNEIKK